MNATDIHGKARFDSSRQSLHFLLIRSFCHYLNPKISFQYLFLFSLFKKTA